MTDLSLANGQQLEQAHALLKSTQALIDQALSNLKSRSMDGGKVSPSLLDEQQLVSYELSLSWSECTAAAFLLKHADALSSSESSDAAFPQTLAAFFCAETVNNCASRLRSRPADYGLDLATIEAVSASPSALSFLTAQLSARNVESIGVEVLHRNGDIGPDLLGEHHTMMRDTFHRFADEVVAPLAEDIHRNDLIIPDEILNPLKEMGMFALSIPESYGGLQEDDREDTLGMIVVTEELSRGSLGAAGSLITRPEILSRALLKGGTEEQKQHWLPKLAVGEPLCAVAVTDRKSVV